MDDDFMFLMVDFAALAARCYTGIAKLLTLLDIPIEMEPAEIENGSEILDSVHHARRLIYQAPMQDIHRAAINTAMLQYLGANHLAEGADPWDRRWMLETGMLMLLRLEREIGMAEMLLRGEIEMIRVEDDDDKE